MEADDLNRLVQSTLRVIQHLEAQLVTQRECLSRLLVKAPTQKDPHHEH